MIRKAKIEDAPSFIEIKNQLPFTFEDGSSTTGGFLLGTDIETYKTYIEHCYCLVAEVAGKIVGFGILLPDDYLRKSDIWQRRYHASWEINLGEYETKKLCYFEQLAFLKGHSRLVLLLAYNLINWVFEQEGHQVLLTTTVNKPITNLAAIPYILAASGAKVGAIEETYPSIGLIHSDIYKIEAAHFFSAVKSHPLFPFLCANPLSFYNKD